MKGLVIPTSFDDKPYIIELGKDSLQTYYKTIGCRVIDIVTLGYDKTGLAIDAVIDDEGLLNHSPVNERFFFAYLAQLICSPLFGTVVIVMTNENTGNTTKLNLAKVKNLLVSNFGFMESDFPEENTNENV